MAEAKQKLEQRSEKIKEGLWNSNDRVVLDTNIDELLQSAEDALKALRQVFKVYQAKNKRIVEPFEIENRSKNIDLLRKNLNLLQQEKKS